MNSVATKREMQSRDHTAHDYDKKKTVSRQPQPSLLQFIQIYCFADGPRSYFSQSDIISDGICIKNRRFLNVLPPDTATNAKQPAEIEQIRRPFSIWMKWSYMRSFTDVHCILRGPSGLFRWMKFLHYTFVSIREMINYWLILSGLSRRWQKK